MLHLICPQRKRRQLDKRQQALAIGTDDTIGDDADIRLPVSDRRGERGIERVTIRRQCKHLRICSQRFRQTFA